jgi:hypothetical protein
METLRPEFVEFIPNQKENGVLYISKEYEVAVHLCACGCGEQVVTPLNLERESTGWNYEENDGKVTLSPSIGNFAGQNPYHAHYFIIANRIVKA